MFNSVVKSKCKRCATVYNFTNLNNRHIDIALKEDKRSTDFPNPLKLINDGEIASLACKKNTECINETTLILPDSNKYVIVYVPHL